MFFIVRYFIFAAVALSVIAFPGGVQASASGTVSGYVRDQDTRNALPGASIIVEGTTFGAMADKNGFYIIYNLPVGKYTLRATMIGYVPTKVTNVQVKTDLNTLVNLSLSAQVLQVPQEIIVTAPRIKIYKDVVSSVHYLGEQELSASLPAQSFQDALPLVPGFVANHFRGGRSSNTLYLIDGLPASGPLTRDLAFMAPNTAIAEMVVQTGGFNPEYGNVSAGLVNIITKEGRNNFYGAAKITTEALGRREQGFENSRRAEFAIGGPLTLGLGGPIVETTYLISGNLNLSDTPQREAMQQAFASPVISNYDLNTKLTIRANNNLYLRCQALLSDWAWRKYDPQWGDRLTALPKRRNRNLRASLSLTHTLSPVMFYKLDLVGMELWRSVLGEATANAPSNLSLDSPAIASVWLGAAEPWAEQTVERQLTAYFSMVRQLHPIHQIKLGVEANWWDLHFDRTRYLLWPIGLQTPSKFVYSRYVDAYRRFPYTVAGYLQHKIELSSFLAHFGVRYELFAPNARQQNLPIVAVPQDSTSRQPRNNKSRVHYTIAPRFGLAIPIGDIEHLSFNYGWFYELPPFYYVYLSDKTEQEAFWPILGNINLKPLRSVAWEVTYRRAVSQQSVFSITGFFRDYKNLIDTWPYSLNTLATIENPATVYRYENNANAQMSGFEIAYKRDFGRGVAGALAYTYSRSVGTASWPETSFLAAARGGTENGRLLFPLAWDQRHTFTMNLGYHGRNGVILSLLSKTNGPATTIDWLTAAERNLPWRHDVDLKISVPLRWDGIKFKPYAEIHNLLNERDLRMDEGGLDLSQPISSLYTGMGRRIWVGLSFGE